MTEVRRRIGTAAPGVAVIAVLTIFLLSCGDQEGRDSTLTLPNNPETVRFDPDAKEGQDSTLTLPNDPEPVRLYPDAKDEKRPTRTITPRQAATRDRAVELVRWLCDSSDEEFRLTLDELRELLTYRPDSLEVAVDLVLTEDRGHKIITDLLQEVLQQETGIRDELIRIVERELREGPSDKVRERLLAIQSDSP